MTKMSTAEPYFDRDFWLDPTISGFLPSNPDNAAQLDFQEYLPFIVANSSQLTGTFQSLSNISFNYDAGAFSIQSVENVVDAAGFASVAHNEHADSRNVTTTPDATKSQEVLPDSPQSIDASKHSSKTVKMSKRNEKATKAEGKQKRRIKEPRPKSAKKQIEKIAYLERNRVSAFISRIKGKEWEHNLESKKDALETKHRTLRTEYARLLRETLDLKNDVLSHARCKDDKVNAWISSEARTFVRRMSNVEKQALDNNSSLPTDNGGMFNLKTPNPLSCVYFKR